MKPIRSRTSVPGSISQKRARSKSGPSGGTTTLNRVMLSVPLRRPMFEKPPSVRRRTSSRRSADLSSADGPKEKKRERQSGKRRLARRRGFALLHGRLRGGG